MRNEIRLAVIGLGLIAVIGCGGSSGSPAAASQGAPAATAGAGSTQAPGASTAPSTAAATDQPSAGGGGGSATGVCALVTADELKGIFGVPVTTEVIAGPPDTCDIQTNDAPLAATVLTSSGAPIIFDLLASGAGTTAVSGLGDKAIYEPTSKVLLVLKGDSMVSIAVFDDGTQTPEERLELMKKVGLIAAGRM